VVRINDSRNAVGHKYKPDLLELELLSPPPPVKSDVVSESKKDEVPTSNPYNISEEEERELEELMNSD
jgi:hypothetical protein